MLFTHPLPLSRGEKDTLTTLKKGEGWWFTRPSPGFIFFTTPLLRGAGGVLEYIHKDISKCFSHTPYPSREGKKIHTLTTLKKGEGWVNPKLRGWFTPKRR